MGVFMEEEEKERLRNSYIEARSMDRQTCDGLRQDVEALQDEKKRLHSELEGLQERCDNETVARADAERSLHRVHREKEELSARIVQLQKSESQHDAVAERIIAKLREDLEVERARNADLEHELDEQRVAFSQLKADLELAKKAEDDLLRDAGEAIERSAKARQLVENTWREKLDWANSDIERLKREIERLGGGRSSISVASYLRDEAGVDAGTPRRPVEQRPEAAMRVLHGHKLDILATVEREGWHAVKWKDGFTMLH